MLSACDRNGSGRDFRKDNTEHVPLGHWGQINLESGSVDFERLTLYIRMHLEQWPSPRACPNKMACISHNPKIENRQYN